MKLALCTIHNRDKGRLSEALVAAGFKFTVVSSTGGFLREGNTTLYVGMEDHEVEDFKSLVGEQCRTREQIVSVPPMEAAPPGGLMSAPVKVPVGGAVVFFLPIDEFARF
jgi:uncharacterized protein YaaQ